MTDDVEQTVGHVLHFYRNYHSQRYVRDDLVIRMHRRLESSQLGALNDQFADIVTHGQIEATDPLKGETTHLEMPRLRFVFTRRNYGRRRKLIGQINDFDLANDTAASDQPSPQAAS